MAEGSTRLKALDLARTWVDTPYRHQASVRGVGCDCLGLIRGVWQELYGREAEQPPAYRPHWQDMDKRELLLEKAREYLIPLGAVNEGLAGDVLVFRMHRNFAAKHCGILSTDGRLLHALEGLGVKETYMTPEYEVAAVGAFRFPER